MSPLTRPSTHYYCWACAKLYDPQQDTCPCPAGMRTRDSPGLLTVPAPTRAMLAGLVQTLNTLLPPTAQLQIQWQYLPRVIDPQTQRQISPAGLTRSRLVLWLHGMLVACLLARHTPDEKGHV